MGTRIRPRHRPCDNGESAENYMLKTHDEGLPRVCQGSLKFRSSVKSYLLCWEPALLWRHGVLQSTLHVDRYYK